MPGQNEEKAFHFEEALGEELTNEEAPKEEEAVEGEEAAETTETTETPAVETEATEEAEDADDFSSELERLSKLVNERSQTPTPKESRVAEAATESEQTAQREARKETNFLDGLEISPELGFDKPQLGFLNSLLNKVAEATRNETLAQVGQLVPATVQESLYTRMKVMDFYTANPDLSQHRSYVGVIYNEMQAQNPDKQMDDLLTLTAAKARKVLGLKATVNPEDRPGGNGSNPGRTGKPGGAKPGGGKPSGSNTKPSELQKFLNDVTEL